MIGDWDRWLAGQKMADLARDVGQGWTPDPTGTGTIAEVFGAPFLANYINQLKQQSLAKEQLTQQGQQDIAKNYIQGMTLGQNRSLREGDWASQEKIAGIKANTDKDLYKMMFGADIAKQKMASTERTDAANRQNRLDVTQMQQGGASERAAKREEGVTERARRKEEAYNPKTDPFTVEMAKYTPTMRAMGGVAGPDLDKAAARLAAYAEKSLDPVAIQFRETRDQLGHPPTIGPLYWKSFLSGAGDDQAWQEAGTALTQSLTPRENPWDKLVGWYKGKAGL
jgi:hypothetical protein